MDSRHEKIRMKVECDRLSNLPEDLIFKILSFIGTKHAVKTSVLSSRWRYIWASMPSLSFSIDDFQTLVKFSKFVAHVLSCRNNQAEVFSVELTFRMKVGETFAKRISNKVLNYALSHNAQQLNITCPHGKKIEFPLSVFSSQSLKHLTLTRFTCQNSITTPRTWKLTALATLNLCGVTLYGDDTDKSAGLFSNCPNLKNLTLDSCKYVGLNGFRICHPGLCNLTLENCCDFNNVVTPKLKSLTIRSGHRMHLISTPNLVSLHFKGSLYPLPLSTDLVHLEKVDLCFYHPSGSKGKAHDIVCLLKQLRNVKILTLNSEIIKILSSSMGVISHQPSPFANLKSLRIYPRDVYPEEQTRAEVTMSTEVKNYLLDGSPGATFTMVSQEEARAMMNATSAQNLMRELQILLDELKDISEKDIALMGSHVATVGGQEETMAYIKSYWKDLNCLQELGHRRSVDITSKLQKIKGVLRKLPASHRAKLQARFSGLCAEADTVMDNMMYHLKFQCDEKPRFKCLFFDELAAAVSQPS